MGRRGLQGFTLLELFIVVAVLGVMAALAVPSMVRWQQGQKLRVAARTVAEAFSTARSEAIRTGNVHIVFFQTDAQGLPLLDVAGNPVPILILDDGLQGSINQNCRIDLGEPIETYPAQPGVAWGVSGALAPPADDAGGGLMATGSTFTEPNGNPATWLMFLPQGFPVAISPGCVVGAVGSGAGAVYVTDGNRDYSMVLSPLGVVRSHTWDRASGLWSN